MYRVFLIYKIDNFPFVNSISVWSSVRLFNLPAKAAAHAAVPQAFVNPAPLSQTLTLIKFLLITLAIVTLHFSGNILWFSISGPIFATSKSSILSTKKITWGLPTFIAVPPECSLLFWSLILIFKFFVFNSSDSGISFHLIFAFPISVVTRLFPNISDFKFPDIVVKIIVLIFFSF